MIFFTLMMIYELYLWFPPILLTTSFLLQGPSIFVTWGQELCVRDGANCTSVVQRLLFLPIPCQQAKWRQAAAVDEPLLCCCDKMKPGKSDTKLSRDMMLFCLGWWYQLANERRRRQRWRNIQLWKFEQFQGTILRCTVWTCWKLTFFGITKFAA